MTSITIDPLFLFLISRAIAYCNFCNRLTKTIHSTLPLQRMETLGFFLAALVGVTLGVIGGGGSILTLPILVYVMGVDPVLATSYSLFVVGTTSLVGAVNSYRSRHVDLNAALLFGTASITTVFVTRKLLLPLIPDVIIQTSSFRLTHPVATMLLFALLMVVAAIAMIRNKELEKQPVSENNMSSRIMLLVYGVLIGLITGFLGAGGGFLLIPALVLLLKMPMKKAIGTSLMIIAMNSLIGFTGDIGRFPIDWKFLIEITGVASAGIFIGAGISRKIAGRHLKRFFGYFVLAMGLYIIIHELFIN